MIPHDLVSLGWLALSVLTIGFFWVAGHWLAGKLLK